MLFLIFIFLTCLLYLHSNRGYNINTAASVHVETIKGNYRLVKDGKPFFIQGAAGQGFIKELAEAGGNTLRVYDTTNLETLFEEAKKYDVSLIVDIPIPSSTLDEYYSNNTSKSRLSEKVTGIVNKYKDRKELLFWNLGNETNFGLTNFSSDFIDTFNSLIDLIHRLDPNHLVGTTVSGTSRNQILGFNLKCPQLDIIGYNAFTSLKSINSKQRLLSFIMDLKPYYIAEWGWNGPWEVQKNDWGALPSWSSLKKSKILEKHYSENKKAFDASLGSLVFYWGEKYEGTPTWFNILDSSGHKSSSYYKVAETWGKQFSDSLYPNDIKSLDLFGLKKDSIFSPNSQINALVELTKLKDTIHYKWEIYQENAHHRKWRKLSNKDLQLRTVDSLQPNKIQFIAPSDTGVYRLMVFAYDLNGNMSTDNASFYILKHDL